MSRNRALFYVTYMYVIAQRKIGQRGIQLLSKYSYNQVLKGYLSRVTGCQSVKCHVTDRQHSGLLLV